MENEGLRRLREKERRSSSTPRNAFFCGLSVIPDNRYLTEWILSVKPRLYADKLLILSGLSVKHPFITDKLSILSQPYSVICKLRENKSEKDSPKDYQGIIRCRAGYPRVDEQPRVDGQLNSRTA